MTSHALALLIAASLVKGAAFGTLFAWAFPRFNGFVLRRMGQTSAPPAAFASRMFWGLAVLAGSGFAMLDLIEQVAEAAGLPVLLPIAVGVLFALSAFGTVLIVQPRPVGTGV